MFPGLAVASALRARGHAIAVVLSGRAVENDRAAAALPEGAESLLVPVRPVSPRDPLSVFVMAAGIVRALRAFRRFRPDALLAMGSYTSFAPVIAARWLGIPVVLHEANTIPGKAIARLARFAHTVCLTFPEAEKCFPKRTRFADTGVPLRAEFAAGIGSSKADPNVFALLVMGGSQGAQAINEAVVAALALLRDRDPALFARLRVTHLAGSKNEADVRALYDKAGLLAEASQITVYGFSNEMPRHYAEADVCLSRAGASSCFELALAGLPAVFVPLPNLAGDHQVFNAKSMAGRGAGLCLEQKDLSAETLADTLTALANDPVRRAALREALLPLARPDAAERVAAAVEAAARP